MKQQISAKFEELKFGDFKSYSFSDVYEIIKYHKDISMNLSLLSGVREEIQRKYYETRANPDCSRFDKYAYSINYNYAVNNELSLICASEQMSIDDAIGYYDFVQKVQDETQVRNFFPHFKFLQYLVSELDNILEKKEALLSIDVCEKIFKYCEVAITHYKKCIKWTQRSYSYAFQLPESECFYKLDDGQSLFIASAHILPLPGDKYVEEFADLRREFYEKRPVVDILRNVEIDINESKATIAEIKDREARTMEILGIFTAIISFVAASVQSYSFIKTPIQAFGFMLALSTSFASFVLILMLAFRGRDKIKGSIWWITGFVGFAAIFWVVFLVVTGVMEQSQPDSNAMIDEKPIVEWTQSINVSDGKESAKVSSDSNETWIESNDDTTEVADGEDSLPI